MVGVSYALADFVTGGPILDLPVMEGASWTAQLNRPDVLSCTIDMRDPDALALDLRAATEPKKTVLLARTDDDAMLAWGLIDDDRVWDEDTQTLAISAKGVASSWLDNKIVGPVAARTATLTTAGLPNLALDTTISDVSLGGMGRELVRIALTWPNAPTWFELPALQAGDHEDTFAFTDLKKVGKVLSDLTDREGGPDFAFDLFRAPDGMSLICRMRHGSESTPRIGTWAGIWPLGGTESPISNLKGKDNANDVATANWMISGKNNDTVMMSRKLSDDMILSGYPPLDYTDSSRNDVVKQSTLNSYNNANAEYTHDPYRSISFVVAGDASPALGEYRPGDRVTIDVPDGHPFFSADIGIRITSMSGNETGKLVTIGCDVLQ